MQTSKQLSPQTKKNSHLNGSGCGQKSTTAPSSGNDLAQRVMDVTLPSVPGQSDDAPSNSNANTSALIPFDNEPVTNHARPILKPLKTTTTTTTTTATTTTTTATATTTTTTTAAATTNNRRNTKKSDDHHQTDADLPSQNATTKMGNSSKDNASMQRKTGDDTQMNDNCNGMQQAPATAANSTKLQAVGDLNNNVNNNKNLHLNQNSTPKPSVSSISTQSLLLDSSDSSFPAQLMVIESNAGEVNTSVNYQTNQDEQSLNPRQALNGLHSNDEPYAINRSNQSKLVTTAANNDQTIANDQLVSCQSVFKQIISKNVKPPATGDNEQQTNVAKEKRQLAMANNANCPRATCISLDTCVPHPSDKRNGFHSEEEEVSYLNLGVHHNTRAAGSSLDNTTKPILLAAAKEQRLGSLAKTATSFQHLQPSPIQLQQNQFRQQTTSAHEYEGVNSDYDENNARYGNALVEKRHRQRELENERMAMAARNRRTNIIESLYDCSTNTRQEKSSVKQPRSNHGSSSSIPPSPKAKSAPATPCNVTPTAFHQHDPNNLVSSRGATIGGQVCIKGNNDTRRVLINTNTNGNNDNNHNRPLVSLQDLNKLIKAGEMALEKKDYQAAIVAFSHCIDSASNSRNISFLKENFKIYGSRAEAHLQMGNYRQAIDDSMAARELNPKWTEAYHLQGRAQSLIGEHVDSLAVFSYGLAQDPSNITLFRALIEAALQSDYRQEFKFNLEKLRSLNLDERPFVVVSMFGQELLTKGYCKHAAIILESALKLESQDDKKFKSSVLSSIAFAFCVLKDYEKALTYMQRELDVENELEDVDSQCKVLSNLGFTYYKLRKFDKCLEAHRKQLNLAMKSNLFSQASMALNAIGHVHVSRGDFPNALTSHTRCLDILRQLGGNEFSQFKEILSIGHVCLMMFDTKSAEERFKEADQLLTSSQCKLNPEEFKIGLIMHRFNIAHFCLKKQNSAEAKYFYSEAIRISRELARSNHTLGTLYEMRSLAALGHTFRLSKRFEDARIKFREQLELAQTLGDQAGMSQALCNLGMTSQHFKELAQARRYFEENLRLVEKNPLLKAYAHSYMGSIHFLLGHYAETKAHYASSLSTFRKLEYCSAEKKTVELNMRFAEERLGHQDVSFVNSPGEQVASSTTHHKRVLMAS